MLELLPGGCACHDPDVGDLEAAVDFRPSASIGTGTARFVAWYKSYYGVE